MIDQTKLCLLFKNGVYAGLALNVNIETEESEARLAFFDTNRFRLFRGKVIRRSDQKVLFRTQDGDDLELVVATRALYDKHARPFVEGNVPVFEYEEDLHEWYRRRFL